MKPETELNLLINFLTTIHRDSYLTAADGKTRLYHADAVNLATEYLSFKNRAPATDPAT